jgi:hypothetical protein
MGFGEFIKNAFVLVLTIGIIASVFFGFMMGFLWVLGKVLG